MRWTFCLINMYYSTAEQQGCVGVCGLQKGEGERENGLCVLVQWTDRLQLYPNWAAVFYDFVHLHLKDVPLKSKDAAQHLIRCVNNYVSRTSLEG